MLSIGSKLHDRDLIKFLKQNQGSNNLNPKFRTKIETECGKDLFFWSAPEFGGKILKFGTEIEPICSEDLFYVAHTAFYSTHTKQALRGNVARDSTLVYNVCI